MTKGDQLLEELFTRFGELGVNWEEFGPEDLKIVLEEVKNDDRIIWINNGIKAVCHFLNDAGKNYYYGISQNYLSDMGFKVYQLMMHPDHFDDFHKAVHHWEHNPKEIYNTTFRVRIKSGDWRWTHSASKALNFTKKGKPVYVLSIVHDVEEIIGGSNYHALKGFKETNQKLFNSLTKREMEIIRLISMERTSEEIADELSIKTVTVDTHRKNMIRKLGVHSSLGLARFYLIFEGSA
ncbi:MAG: PAS domain-containing protein [Bacteroidetes bacterium]|nr:PAS domain-containing protein [Bacteroidota bacterium]